MASDNARYSMLMHFPKNETVPAVEFSCDTGRLVPDLQFVCNYIKTHYELHPGAALGMILALTDEHRNDANPFLVNAGFVLTGLHAKRILHVGHYFETERVPHHLGNIYVKKSKGDAAAWHKHYRTEQRQKKQKGKKPIKPADVQQKTLHV